MFRLALLKRSSEEIMRKIHGENFSVLAKMNSRYSRLEKIHHKIEEVKIKFKQEMRRKRRFKEIIEVCQKNQNLNGFFVKVCFLYLNIRTACKLHNFNSYDFFVEELLKISSCRGIFDVSYKIRISRNINLAPYKKN